MIIISSNPKSKLIKYLGINFKRPRANTFYSWLSQNLWTRQALRSQLGPWDIMNPQHSLGNFLNLFSRDRRLNNIFVITLKSLDPEVQSSTWVEIPHYRHDYYFLFHNYICRVKPDMSASLYCNKWLQEYFGIITLTSVTRCEQTSHSLSHSRQASRCER